ncbi:MULTISPECIES: hypothetical protein [Bacillaceae]|uniref:Uncharacterized protein n=1 Tax=Metabacillus sediminis TaxID=3117746 RepID=A0ABZ2NC57_9BACI|nr:hypothetical protein [Bacillus sp. SJS]KZZ84251.1 hypothetical protein AS29_011865 [Bacillus sp. SJS]
MGNEGIGLLKRQQRMTVLMNSLTAVKTSGELQVVSGDLENLSALLKARLERNRSRTIDPVSEANPDKLIPAELQEASKLNMGLMKANPELRGFSAALKDYISELILRSIRSKWSANIRPAVAAETMESSPMGIAESLQSVFENAVFPSELPVNMGIWNKIASSLPEGYQIPNPKTYSVIADNLVK